MTWTFSINGTANTSVNIAPATGSIAMYDIIAMLMQGGWTKKSDSDATTFSSSGVQVTGGGTGTNGLGNTNAWVRLQDPGGGHEICIQRGTTSLLWRIKWSHSAKFTGGSPSASQVPSATDEQVLLGTGTDAAPTGATVFSTDSLYHLHCGCDNAAPYDFWWVTTLITTGATQKVGLFLNMITGTYPGGTSGDAAPYILEFGGALLSATVTTIGSGYFKKGLSGEAWLATFTPWSYAANTTIQIPKIIGANGYNGNDNGLPIPIGIASGNAGSQLKGFASMNTIAWCAASRNQFDFEDVSASAWVASTAYTAGTRVTNGGNVYLCQVGGTSASSGGPTGTSNAITDNTVTWSYVAPSFRYTVFDSVMLHSPSGVVLS